MCGSEENPRCAAQLASRRAGKLWLATHARRPVLQGNPSRSCHARLPPDQMHLKNFEKDLAVHGKLLGLPVFPELLVLAPQRRRVDHPPRLLTAEVAPPINIRTSRQTVGHQNWRHAQETHHHSSCEYWAYLIPVAVSVTGPLGVSVLPPTLPSRVQAWPKAVAATEHSSAEFHNSAEF